MTRLAVAERAALVEAMAAAGPDAPTLCEGWTVRDLAAHCVARERRPDASAGIVLRPLAGWGERVRRGLAAGDFENLLEKVRTGPPTLSAFALPGADEAFNLAEFFVHCEDVRRAQPGWAPRPMPGEMVEALWQRLVRQGPLFFRHAGVGVVLATPAGARATVRPGEPEVTMTGEVSELVMYAFGRKRHARVKITGPQDAVARFRAQRLNV